MVRPIDKTPLHLSLDEVAARVGHKVLMALDLTFTDWGPSQLKLEMEPFSVCLYSVFLFETKD